MRSNQSRLMMLSVSTTLVLLPLAQGGHSGEVVRPPAPRPAIVSGDGVPARRTDTGQPGPSLKTIEFTTDEGTWMSVDLSPNGKTIVFDLLGDLYTLPIEGGVATRILEGPAFDGQPRWSPDGKSIVFVSDRDGADGIWIANADGSGARRFKEGTHLAPAWSPDGQFIVATRRGKTPSGGVDNGTVVLYPRDGGPGIEVGGGKGGAGFSPNGQLLYFAAPDFSDWNENVVIYDRATGQTRTRPAGRCPWATPDGKGLVFAAEYDGRSGLEYLDLETGWTRWLMVGSGELNEANPGRDATPGYGVSKDAKTIVAWNGGKLWRIDIARGTRTAIPFNAAVKIEVASPTPIDRTAVADSGPVRANRISTARISPDGRQLVFTALNRLWIQDLPSGTPRRLTKGTIYESWPAWSPDGRFIAFATWGPSGGEILRATPNGAVEKLTKAAGYFDRIGYSADGRRLLAVRGPRSFGPVSRPPGNVGPADLVWLPASGGEPTVITQVDLPAPSRWDRTPATFVGQPFTTRDTSRVYLTDPKIGLVSMRWDGTDRAVVGKGPADDLILSPDGRYLATLGAGTITITAAPRRPGASSVDAMRPTSLNVSVPRHDADQLAWSADGRTLYYAGGSILYRYPVASADSLELRKASDPAGAGAPPPDATSQEVSLTLPRNIAKGTVVLRGGRLITMKGREIIDRGDLVIADGRIVAVGHDLAVPAGARVIDVSGKTVLPGYLEVDGGATPLDRDPSGQSWDDLTRLAYGVTTTGRTGKPSGAALDDAVRIEAGQAIGPRSLETPSGIEARKSPNDTAPAGAWLRAGAPIVRGEVPITPLGDDLVQLVARAGPIYLVGLGKSDGNGPSPRNRFIAEGRYHDDPKLRALVPHSVLDDELSRPEWHRDDLERSTRAAIDAARIVAAGGRVALTTDGGFPGLALHWDLWAANAAGRGLVPHDALRAVTMVAAEALGVSGELGSLEPGKIADLQVVDGDPLADLRTTTKLVWVMKGGRLYDPATLAERWPHETGPVSLSVVDPDPPRTTSAPKPAPARPTSMSRADRPLGGFTVTPITAPRPRDPTYALPLTPTRTVRFATDEGTRMGIDVSPDGKTVLFDMLGDLYTVPISGGKATRIMGGMAMDVQGRYSPDGKRIVFVSDRSGADNLWIADADGKNPRPVRRQGLDTLPDGPSDPAWTPDGRFVVTSGTLYDALTGDETRVPELQGSQVAFGGSPRQGYVGRWGGIQAYDFETGRVTPIITSLRTAYRLAVSRDNRWLAYLDRVDMEAIIRVIDLERGTNTKLVGAPSDSQASQLAIYDDFAFTPDSKALVTTMGGKLWRVELPSGKKTVIPFRADVEMDLGPLSQFQYPITDSVTVRQIREPRLSPDGRRLAFIALDKLYLMDFPKGTPRRVTGSVGVVENHPAWSPDGKFVAFTTSNDTAGGHVYRIEAAGVLDGRRPAAERLTTEPDLYGRLAYGPGGRLVYGRSSFRELHRTQYDYSRDMPVDFYWIDATGGPAHWITRETWNRLEPGAPPHFVLDQPDRIMIPEYNELVSIRWDGSDRRTVARWAGAGYDGEGVIPAQGMLSPDGKKAIVIYRNNLYLATMPAVPMDTVRLNPGRADRGVTFRRLSRFGAEFIGWADQGKRIYFALGRSLFFYDVAKGEQTLRDSLRAVDLARAAGRPNDRAGGEPLLERFDISVVVPRAQAQGTVALRNARLITMKGDEVIENGDLIVENGRIVALGKSGTVAIPKSARVIDAKGKTILPGYVDLHDHMLARFITHNTQSPEYLAHLAYGVTTSRNPSSKTSDFLSYSDRVDAGDMLGPRILGVGPAYSWDRTKDSLTSLEDAQVLIRRYAEFYQTQTFKEYLSGNRLQRQWLVMATHDQGISPTTEGGHDWKMAITELIDGYAGHEHNYETFPLYRDAAMLVAASGISYTLTLVVSYGGPEGKGYYFTRANPHDDAKLHRFTWHEELDNRSKGAPFLPEKEYVFPEVAASAGEIVRAGGHVGIGAHGELQGLGTHWELWMVGYGGLSNLEILRAGTLTGARAVGLDRDIGSLEVGKLADLQVLDENPLEDLRNTNTLRYVMKDGHLYDAGTLDEIWPRQRPLGRQWWQMLEPDSEAVTPLR